MNNNNIGIQAARNSAKKLIDSNRCRMCGLQLCALIYIHTCILCLLRHIRARICNLEERIKEERVKE